MGRNRPPKNIGVLFEWFADAQRPAWVLDRPFDVDPDGGTDYDNARLATLVAESSAALYEAGLRAGDRLGIVKDNHFDVVVLAAAAARIGALPAMVSSAVPAESLQVMMSRLAPKVLVASPGVLDGAVAAGVTLVEPTTRVVVVGRLEGAGEGARAATPLAELRGGVIPAARPVADDEPMVCTHTSGTTGVPKFVAHSATTARINSKLETAKIPFLSTRDDDVIATCVAWVHIRSVTWLHGQLALPPKELVVLAEPDPDSVAEVLGAHRPTTLEACPNIFQRWEPLAAEHPEVFERVRAFVSTFDAIHPRTVRAFLGATKRRGAVWGQSWGQSEVGPVTLGVYTKRGVRRAGEDATTNVGRPVPFVIDMKVVDPETRRPVKRGRPGLVLVRTKGRCLTYLGEDDRHRAKVWDGWWNTGDIGVRRRSGALDLVDREVDVIPGVSGIELESKLLDRLGDATEVIILGVPGRPPVPVISTSDGKLDPQAWRTATADLPELADPLVIGWDDFPRTATWKVRRRVLKEKLFATTETYGTGQWT